MINQHGSALIISSMAGHMVPSLSLEVENVLAFTPADDLSALPCICADSVPDSMAAYCISKKANHLRVQAACLSWGERGARVNSISPGTISMMLALLLAAIS